MHWTHVYYHYHCLAGEGNTKGQADAIIAWAVAAPATEVATKASVEVAEAADTGGSEAAVKTSVEVADADKQEQKLQQKYP